MPALSSQDKAIDAIQDLITFLRNPKPASPFLTYGPKAPAAIETLADIFELNKKENVQQKNAPTSVLVPTETQPPPRVPVRKETKPPPRVPFAKDKLSPPRVPEKAPIALPQVTATHQYGTHTVTRQANN
jgi:hypothetical protein